MRFGDETLLLALLNSAPTDMGRQYDELGDATRAKAWLERIDRGREPGTAEAVRAARADLWAVIRGRAEPETLAAHLAGVTSVLDVGGGELEWRLMTPSGRRVATTAVLTWFEIEASTPGRVRPCGNPDCTMFLIDHSKSNSARWCSMAVCGNRMKARRHHERSRSTSRSAD